MEMPVDFLPDVAGCGGCVAAGLEDWRCAILAGWSWQCMVDK